MSQPVRNINTLEGKCTNITVKKCQFTVIVNEDLELCSVFPFWLPFPYFYTLVFIYVIYASLKICFYTVNKNSDFKERCFLLPLGLVYCSHFFFHNGQLGCLYFLPLKCK